MIYMSDALAANIGKKAILVESGFQGTYYAICKEKKGMWLITSQGEIAISADYAEEFINELKEVWELFGT